MKLSIIVPIYNAEKYLIRCLDSILNQSFKDFEVILINDGSTDKSLDICTSYAKNDSRIILINQKNQGVANARNKGILQAKGEWITFMDDDDFEKVDTYKEIFEAVKKTNSKYNIYQWNVNKLHSGKDRIKDNVKKEGLYNFIKEKGKIPNWYYLWNKIIRTSFLRKANVLMPIDENGKSVPSEDRIFFYELFSFDSNIYCITSINYVHEWHENSLFRSMVKTPELNKEYNVKSLYGYTKMIERLKNRNVDKDIIELVENKIQLVKNNI